MIDAFKKMISNYKDFSGKTTRGDYWWAQLGYFVFEMLLCLVLGILGGLAFVGIDSSNGIAQALGWIIFIVLCLGFLAVNIFLFIADLSISIRRLRDAGFPWWCIFVNFVPSVGQVAYLVFLCFPSSDTPVVNFGYESSQANTNAYSAPAYTSPANDTTCSAEPAPAPAAPVVDVTPEEAPVVEETAETETSASEVPAAEEDNSTWTCPSCGMKNDGKFCPVCGTKRP